MNFTWGWIWFDLKWTFTLMSSPLNLILKSYTFYLFSWTIFNTKLLKPVYTLDLNKKLQNKQKINSYQYFQNSLAPNSVIINVSLRWRLLHFSVSAQYYWVSCLVHDLAKLISLCKIVEMLNAMRSQHLTSYLHLHATLLYRIRIGEYVQSLFASYVLWRRISRNNIRISDSPLTWTESVFVILRYITCLLKMYGLVWNENCWNKTRLLAQKLFFWNARSKCRLPITTVHSVDFTLCDSHFDRCFPPAERNNFCP